MTNPNLVIDWQTLPISPTEHEEQRALIRWTNYMSTSYPELKLLFAIPNGAKLPYSGRGKNRFSKQAIILKEEGLKSGVPDLCLPVAKHNYHGLYIEMKRMPNRGRKGGAPTEEQAWWKDQLTKQGYLSVICWGAEDAIRILSEYLGILIQGDL